MTFSGDGESCEDVDECASDDSNLCQGECINEAGSYSCSCGAGYVLIGAYGCGDIDECNDSPCDANASCNNIDGGYECSCNAGYSGDGASCSDVDECADSPCSADGKCSNTDGGFECACNRGFR